MGIGGALAAVYMILTAVTQNPRSDPLGVGNPSTSAYQAGFVFGGIFATVILAGLWAWMAWKNYRGRSWARILSTVFFGLLSLYVVVIIVVLAAAASQGALGLTLPPVLIVLQWCAGLAALLFVYQRESGQYYAAVRAQLAGYAPVPPGYGYSQPPAYGQPPAGNQPPAPYGQDPGGPPA